jgi:hypothetical protein
MTPIPSIDLSDVTGGATSTSRQQVGVQATIPGVGDVNVGVTNERANTDYKTCVDAVRRTRGTPADIVATCGLPPSQ